MTLSELVDDLPLSTLSGPRSPGLHLSEIIKAKLIARDPERYGQPLQQMRLEVGYTWEQILARALSDRAGRVHPGEVTRDGIICSPDYVSGDGTLEEWKATWTSAKRDVTDQWHYFAQIKAYCYALDLRRANLRVLHVNGAYEKAGWIPVVRNYHLEFTMRELVENWRELRDFAKANHLFPSSTRLRRLE